jgi:hypothetical protein
MKWDEIQRVGAADDLAPVWDGLSSPQTLVTISGTVSQNYLLFIFHSIPIYPTWSSYETLFQLEQMSCWHIILYGQCD